jgi:hypothetical protein
MINQAPVMTALNMTKPESTITHPVWLQWFQEWYDWYRNTGRYTDPGHVSFGQVEPPHTTGLLAYSDGVNWVAGGGGAGYYRWNGGSWVFVG